MKKLILIASLAILSSCKTLTKAKEAFNWDGANLYFLMTDRFKNGDKTNDVKFNRTEKAAVLRSFEGGDLRGIIQKIDDNYFSNLGINAIWMTPLVEQIHGYTDEGTGKTYAFHGYWAKDWSALDPNFGTKKELKELVEKAHKKGIRIVLDAVINHTGPVTPEDSVYPSDWVRTSPKCTYDSYIMTTACTLVANLPDIKTEDNSPAELPKMITDKWKKEGRYDSEMKSLDAFFAKTGYPRAPKYYIMKWLSDYVREDGVDGYRVDTAKHTNADVWKDFQKVCQDALDEFRKNNPSKVLDNQPFYTVGEVYGYGISQKQLYNYGDKKVDFFENGFHSLINFDFKGDANKPYEEIFSNYDRLLHSDLKGKSVLNYLTSHDDGSPFDKNRTRTYEAATKLLLSPGVSQIYYGDESARPLEIKGAEGDANLRSDMNWDDEKNNPETQKLLKYYQVLGKFRANHTAIGAGFHKMISSAPYYFSRILNDDKVVIGLDIKTKLKEVDVSSVFKNGTQLKDFYSGASMPVIEGKVSFYSDSPVVLLEKVSK
jgi:alpha-amylase